MNLTHRRNGQERFHSFRKPLVVLDDEAMVPVEVVCCSPRDVLDPAVVELALIFSERFDFILFSWMNCACFCLSSV
jgi:hypothetical protein